MLTKEIKDYIVQRTHELPKYTRNQVLSNEIREKFNTIVQPSQISDLLRRSLKGIVSEGIPSTGVYADKKIEKLAGFLDERDISIKDLEDLFYHKEMNDHSKYEINQGVDTFKIGVVSDTHLGAKKCAIKELHDFYDILAREGVTDVLHAGDFTDGGGKVYPGQLDELMVYGFDDMKDYTIENYPKRDGITTHFILGNHDEDFKKHGGADIGRAISEVRKDLNYLGFYHADIIINGIKFGLHHGAGGASYAQSYKLQKAVENLTGDRKPQVYILGHYHGSLYMGMRNIHCMLPASFQRSTNFSVRLNLPEIIGGYILEITKTKNNEVRSLVPKFTQYYF